ncbi:MAG: T9SS type A sorting domain-containing protein [Ginsengibacter sp.]
MPRKILPLMLLIQLALIHSLFSQTSEQLRANLYAFNTNGSLSLNDGNLTMYNINNSNAVDGMDAMKMTNFGENFGLLRGAKTLAIERRQSITLADTIFFRMWNMQRKNYKIDLILTGLAQPGLSGVLEDSYLNTKSLLNLNGLNSSIFTINNDTASSASNRFRIIFSLPASAFKVLPITFTGIKAYQKNYNIDIEWTVENEKDVMQYQIEKSITGQQFTTVATIDLKGKGLSAYKWTDISSVKGNNFYRIKSVDINARIQYSSVIKVSAGIENYTISVYPNPVVNGLINIQIVNQPKGIYIARLINNYGQTVHVAEISHNGGSSTQTLQVNKNTGKGSYTLEIITPGNSKTSRKILMQ